MTRNSNMPRFYHLIKTHKKGPNIKIRPIVSNTSGPTQKTSKLLTKILTPLLQDVPAHLNNSTELLKDIQDIPTTTLQKYNYPFSLDVTALYTSIPPKEAIDNLIDKIENKQTLIKPFKPGDIKLLTSAILSNTIFTYKGKFFKQITGLPMGNSLSGLLAILFMDTIERKALSSISTSFALYRRYVDDTFILTTDKEQANNIYQTLNSHHPNIRFEIEHPDKNNSLSLLDFNITTEPNGTFKTEFYQKEAKIDILPHYESAISLRSKENIINNEIKRREVRCSEADLKEKHLQEFQQTLQRNGYPANFNHNKPRPPRNSNKNQRTTEQPIYFELPYISDRIDNKVKRIFKETGMNIRLYRRSYTLRNALKTNTIQQCDKSNCPLKHKLCLKKNIVYKLTCAKCQEIYIGSTHRELHTRFNEHVTNKDGNIYSHKQTCNSQFIPSILATTPDNLCLRFKEAILIGKLKPSINSRAERDEIKNLIF